MAKTYYEQANIVTTLHKAYFNILWFYPIIKACMLTIDPNYPESTSVTCSWSDNKEKKKTTIYGFLQDEVKIQKNGLFYIYS